MKHNQREKQTSSKSWRHFRAQPLLSLVRKSRPRKEQMLAGDGPARLHPRRGACPSREQSLALGTQAVSLPPTWQRPEKKGVPGLPSSQDPFSLVRTYDTGAGVGVGGLFISSSIQRGKPRHGKGGPRVTQQGGQCPSPYLLSTFHPSQVPQKADGRHLIHHSPDGTS